MYLCYFAHLWKLITLPFLRVPDVWITKCQSGKVWTNSMDVQADLSLEFLCDTNQGTLQWTLFITTFVITAKFFISSIWSAQKSADHVFFHWYAHVILQKIICFVYLLESPRQGVFNKYTKPMIHKKTYSKVSIIHALDGSISRFFITTNSI